MNLSELKLAVDAALERGTDPETTVVAAVDQWYAVVDRAVDPLDDDGLKDGYVWFTLHVGESADSRFTPSHEHTQEQYDRITA